MGLVALIRNEKIKASSTVITNLGTALFASAFGRWFVIGVDAWVVAWTVFGAAAIGAGIQFLSALTEESVL